MTIRTATSVPVLLGEAPAPGGDPSTPLGGRNAARLCAIMGWGYRDPYNRLTEHFETLNVIERAEDADPWDPRAASARWQEFVRTKINRRSVPFVVVVFGRRAAVAVGAKDRAYYDWHHGQLYTSVVVPHPSGRNRLWNDPATAARVREALAHALRLAEKVAA